MIYGREQECGVLLGLLEEAGSGHSTAVVVEGEPGIGKTALLEVVRSEASGMRVLSATGVESETDLPFATLHRLLLPVLDLCGSIPAPQGEALRGALGLARASGHSRFLVAAAVLSILGKRPVTGAWCAWWTTHSGSTRPRRTPWCSPAGG